MPFSRLPPRMQKKSAVITGALVLLLIGILVGVFYRQPAAAVREVNFTQLREMAEAGRAQSVEVSGEVVSITQADGTLVRSVVTNAVAQAEVASAFERHSIPVAYATQQPGVVITALGYVLPAGALLLFALIGWRVYASMGGSQNDIASTETGGGQAPRGILLSGPPGTGKTLLARAAATEAKVPFLSVSGSSFQEKFAGLGASRVRRLFARARKLAPCVIFIDEIDALGRRRGRGGDSASADQDQTLNQLLVEMDGFEQLSGVVVIASTNRPDILDSALTRPGRFDREITVNLADMRGREQILRVHSRKLKLEEGLDLSWIARGTPGFSGADLANLLNEAAIAATRDDSEAVGRPHVEYARDKILMGVERKGFMMEEEERYATAGHEAGHVAVGLAVKNGDQIHKVSILPRGRALGVTQALPERDRLMRTREYLEDQIAMLLGGRAAEILLLDTMTAGASNDIERAVEIARRMVAEFGMSPLGPIHLG